jgi:dihydrofolate reductase
MASLTVDVIMSLDGYGADGGQEHVALMGATTYRLMSGFAGEMPDDPGLAGLTAATKLVFSSTLQPPLSWANTELISGDAIEAVRDRKGRGSRPMRTVGSVSLCRSLLTAGLVDRFRVVVFPVITGATGTDRIFDGYPDIALDLVDSRLFDGRLQLLEYVPRVLDGPPGADG